LVTRKERLYLGYFHEESQMGKIARPEEVRYLSFEGGGGKGVAYLGAIKALEDYKVLPIDLKNPERNQLKGISGASAGAITALFLALGYNSIRLEALLKQVQVFEGFYDDPAPGQYRVVDRTGRPISRSDIDSAGDLWKKVRENFGSADTPPIDIFNVSVAAFESVLKGLDRSNVMVKQLQSAPKWYLYNLIVDRGLFPGFAVRNFFTTMINTELSGHPLYRKRFGSALLDPRVDFDLFFRMTNIDLVVTGTNISSKSAALFSRRHTPKFPVAEAVSISMNLPVIFKPVFIETDIETSKYVRATDQYHGLWVDGGMLNNLPIRVFDEFGPKISSKYPNVRILNPDILGMRLTPGLPPGSAGGVSASQPKHVFGVFLGYLGDLLDTMLSTAESGQIRSIEEADQTIELYTYDLETTDFAPSESVKKKPIFEAEQAVRSYFKSK
jgi:predicted acylesterase/phospholipase RssA